MPEEKIILVEKTAKRWKAMQSAGFMLALLGAWIIWHYFDRSAHPVGWWTGATIAVVGLILYVSGRSYAWWNHG